MTGVFQKSESTRVHTHTYTQRNITVHFIRSQLFDVNDDVTIADTISERHTLLCFVPLVSKNARVKISVIRVSDYIHTIMLNSSWSTLSVFKKLSIYR